MPHIPDSNHANHDLELIAAFAAGDTTGADLVQAQRNVDGCVACAALHADLVAIASALPSLPAPIRPRDFRLTTDDARRLRPSGLRGVLAAFASPRFSFATPLGTGLAALGLAGVLVASGGLPIGGATGDPAALRDTGTRTADTLVQPEGSAEAQAPAAGIDATSVPRENAVAGAAQSSLKPVQVPGADGRAGGLSEGPAATAGPAGAPGEDATGGAGGVANAAPASPDAPAVPGDAAVAAEASGRTPAESLLIVAGAALLVGCALIVLRVMARRMV